MIAHTVGMMRSERASKRSERYVRILDELGGYYELGSDYLSRLCESWRRISEDGWIILDDHDCILDLRYT